jgi:hypothetical protein
MLGRRCVEARPLLNIPNDGPSWDMNAELLGLQEANGIVFLEGAQVLGSLELPSARLFIRRTTAGPTRRQFSM